VTDDRAATQEHEGVTDVESGGAASGDSAPIVVEHVTRWFGNVVAVNDVSVEFRPGVTGLLGPNGAGKTTLLRMIAGLSEPSSGSISVLGQAVRGDPAIFRRMGLMPEHEGVYSFMTGRAFVEFNAKLHGVKPLEPAVDRAVGLVGLELVQHRTLGGYSRGMRQRMRLAAALVHNPEVLLLDEPLSGTDPRQRLEFQRIVRQLASEGRTIVISSHILEEVEVMAREIVLMVSGKVAASGDFRAIRRAMNERPYLVRVGCSDTRQLAAALVRSPEVNSVTIEDSTLLVRGSDVRALQRAIPLAAAAEEVRLTRVEPLDDTLESVFTYLAGRSRA
jgi:ABC-2 type transport system ATP-binding protein